MHSKVLISVNVMIIAAVALAGCGDEVTQELPSEAPDINVEKLPLIETQVIDTVVTESLEVRFLARDPLPGEGRSPIVTILTLAEDGASDPVETLLNEDATPLEVYYHLKPEGTPSTILIDDHEAATRRTERSPETRSYAQKSQSIVSSNAIDSRCNSTSSFQSYAQQYTDSTKMESLISLRKSDAAIARKFYNAVEIWAPTSSSKDVRVRVCNPNSYGSAGGCFKDRFRVNIWAAGAGGGGVVYSGLVQDCHLLKYHWPSRVAGFTYGAWLSDPEVNPGGRTHWSSCDYGRSCTGLHGRVAIGWQP